MIIKQREELHSSKKHECPIEMENITRVCYIKTSMILKASCILESIQTLTEKCSTFNHSSAIKLTEFSTPLIIKSFFLLMKMPTNAHFALLRVFCNYLTVFFLSFTLIRILSKSSIVPLLTGSLYVAIVAVFFRFLFRKKRKFRFGDFQAFSVFFSSRLCIALL